MPLSLVCCAYVLLLHAPPSTPSHPTSDPDFPLHPGISYRPEQTRRLGCSGIRVGKSWGRQVAVSSWELSANSEATRAIKDLRRARWERLFRSGFPPVAQFVDREGGNRGRPGTEVLWKEMAPTRLFTAESVLIRKPPRVLGSTMAGDKRPRNYSRGAYRDAF